MRKDDLGSKSSCSAIPFNRCLHQVLAFHHDHLCVHVLTGQPGSIGGLLVTECRLGFLHRLPDGRLSDPPEVAIQVLLLVTGYFKLLVLVPVCHGLYR